MNDQLFIPIDLHPDNKGDTKDMLCLGADIAKHVDWGICIFHAFTVPLAPPGKDGGYKSHASIEKQKREDIQQFISGIPELGNTDFDIELAPGIASDLISDVARKKSARLILMGTNGAHGLREHLTGTVAEQVTMDAHCPVLIVPEKGNHNISQTVTLLLQRSNANPLQLDFVTSLADHLGNELHVTYIEKSAGKNGVTLPTSYRYLSDRVGGNGIQTYQSLLLTRRNGHDIAEQVLANRSADKKDDILAIPYQEENLLKRSLAPGLMRQLMRKAEAPLLVLK